MNVDKMSISLSKEPKWYYTLLYNIFSLLYINIYLLLFYFYYLSASIWKAISAMETECHFVIPSSKN